MEVSPRERARRVADEGRPAETGMFTRLVSLFSCQQVGGAGGVRPVPAGLRQPPPTAGGVRAAPSFGWHRGVAQGESCSAGGWAGCVTPVAIALGLGKHESQQERCCKNVLTAQSWLKLACRIIFISASFQWLKVLSY